MRSILKCNTRIASAFFPVVACLFGLVSLPAQPLTTLDYKVTGQVMQVTPAALAVPKGIAGSVGVAISGEVAAGAYVEAILRGPSFPARRLVGAANQPLMLPPLNLSGDYSLDGIRLVGADGGTLLEGSPASVPVKVFEEVLVSRVTSRPLTLSEIEERGIEIDNLNFRAVEFEVAFVVDGKSFPVKLPVVSPSFRQATEIIPAAELQERLAQAELINQQLSESVGLPKALETVMPQFQVKGINMEFGSGGGEDLALAIPPIPALMVIPGNIGFLNQFFSVQIYTENAAPSGSGLSVHSLTAELVLPEGPDRVAGSFEVPGDDPLRLARVNGSLRNIVPVRAVGPDGQSGTSDDVDRLQSGDTGQGELLVEGLQEGLHVMDLKLAAKLDGLAAGTVAVTGKAAGSILVRNPKFSMAFTHPRTVRFNEPYEAVVTILNTSSTAANLISIELNSNNISGGLLLSAPRVELGTIAPGETRSATFRIKAKKTGAITFSNLTTSDDSVVGRFRLKAGVDERGVALSPDSLVLPEFLDLLPPSVAAAAQRVLGQALSSNMAGQLPPGVVRVSKSLVRATEVTDPETAKVTRRGGGSMVLALLEAAQRARFGESLRGILPDLLLDWNGAREFDAGWDQLIRETDAGREWREALQAAMEAAEVAPDHAVARLVGRQRDLAGRGESWLVAASDRGSMELSYQGSGGDVADGRRSGVAKTAGYPGAQGGWLVAADPGVFTWKMGEALAGEGQLSVALIRADGTARELLWRVGDLPAGAKVIYDARGDSEVAGIDEDGDGSLDRSLAAVGTDFRELPPRVLRVEQDAELVVGRPKKPCPIPTTTDDLGNAVPIGNYANVVAVLFSKPMSQATADVPAAYRLENGNEAAFVQVQPGGRLALLTMKAPLGGIIERSMTVSEAVTDVRGNAMVPAATKVATRLMEGVNVRGRVMRADGSFAAGVPVTLTYEDSVEGGLSGDCVKWIRRVAQVRSDGTGEFAFDFVVGGIPYSLSATDTAGLSSEAVDLILGTSVKGEVNAAKLEELAGQEKYEGTLLAEFAAGAMPEAIAKAEGLDRALVDDLAVPGRFMTESFYALRFRGRGTVTGQVVLEDGASGVRGAAVNLFPDVNSRELGRGVFSDSEGRFAFYGVPLGPFTLSAMTAEGLTRTVSGLLLTSGETVDVAVALGATAPSYAEWTGRLAEADGSAVVGGAVYVGEYQRGGGFAVYGRAVTDASGYYSIAQVPVGSYTALGLSLDGKRQGSRGPLVSVAGVASVANIVLQARAVVQGVVQFANGDPVAGASVGGGEALATTDALGRFKLEGVPTGSNREISAGFVGVETHPDPRKHMTRLASERTNVQAGDNFVVIRFASQGRIVGKVIDANEVPVPFETVALPVPSDPPFFLWVRSDEHGEYEFPGLALDGPVGGAYDLSAPSPPVTEEFDGEKEASKLMGASSEEVAAIIGKAFTAFTGVNNPLLRGGEAFNPVQWGFVKSVRLTFDGDTKREDIRYAKVANLSGTVTNGQGVPIGARVRLTGIGPSGIGLPSMVVRGEKNSDPALGTFSFMGQAFLGDWGLQAASPFFPTVIATSGRTTSAAPDVSGLKLEFPRVQEINGSLTGQVLLPDGQAAGANVEVRVAAGSDDARVLRTDEAGRFSTGASLYSLRGNTSYQVTVFDPATGGQAQDFIGVKAAQDNFITLSLLGRGDAEIFVEKADGAPAAGAAVEIQGGRFPAERATGVADGAGRIVFTNLFAGPYAVTANTTIGLTRVAGRAGLVLPDAGVATVRLSSTASVTGVFLASDGVTPVESANVRLGSFAYAPTDAAGRFQFADVPLGVHVLTAVNQVNGRGGRATVSLTQTNEVRDLRIVETSLGTVSGMVINAEGTGTVRNAEVELKVDDAYAMTPMFKVTSGPNGEYSIAGVEAGSFSVAAAGRLANGNLSGDRGQVRATLLSGVAAMAVDVPFDPRGGVAVRVLQADGVTPAARATVRLYQEHYLISSADTNDAGQAIFAGLSMGSYGLVAVSQVPGESRDRSRAAFVILSERGQEVSTTLTMRGVGSLVGTVLLADGRTVAAGAEVTWKVAASTLSYPSSGAFEDPASGFAESLVVGDDGAFSLTNLPVGLTVQLSAKRLGLAAAETVADVGVGANRSRELLLTASGTLVGRMLRGDGRTVAAGTQAAVAFPSRSGLQGAILQIVGEDGRFSLAPVPQGEWSLQGSDSEHGGLAFRRGAIAANGEVGDLGDIVLDESHPQVVSTVPGDTSEGVDINSEIEVTFSEALEASSVFGSGVFVRPAAGGAAVAATLRQSAANVVRIKPSAPLASETAYQIVVVDGELRNAVGEIIHRGPQDLVGRALVGLYSGTFTTRDQRPPEVLSFTPGNGAEEVDERTTVRLSFDEPVQAGAAITLTGPSGPVLGQTSLGVKNLVLTFVPEVLLPPNTSFTIRVSGVKDVAGNDLAGQPLVCRFATLDNQGPVLADLRLKQGVAPVGGSAVVLEAVPEAMELGLRVRFTADFQVVGTTAENGVELPFVMPGQGAITFGAIAIDRFDNEGPLREFRVAVAENQPPVIAFEKLIPATGNTVLSGSAAQVRVTVSDDGAVTSFRAAGTGAWTAALQSNATGTPITLSSAVPPSTIPGSKIAVLASAGDNSGRSTGEQRFELEVADGTAPALAFVSPAAEAMVDPDEPLVVVINTTDNSGDVTLEVSLSGGVTGVETVVVDGSPNLAKASAVRFDMAAAPQSGGTLTATARATDAAGRRTTMVRRFHLPDRRAPQLSGAAPDSGAIGQSLWTEAVLTFDEAMKADTFSAANIEFPGSFTVLRNESDTVFSVRAASALAPGSRYSLRLKPGLSDVAGNLWQEAGGVPMGPEGKELVFTTAAFASTAPLAHAKVVPGQTLVARADFAAGLGADQIVFTTLAVESVQQVNPTASTTASAVLTIPVTAVDPETLFVIARKAGRASFTLPGIPLDVRPRGDDDDEDGISNGQEIDLGMDPFFDDRSLDPDNDGRNNAEEILAGSDPHDADSDDDGLNDGAEFAAKSNALLADSDEDGLQDGAEVALGTNLILADTDGDGLSDGREAGVGRLSAVSGSYRWLEANADAEVRGGHLLTVTSELENAALAAVLPGVGATGFWIGLSDRFVEGEFRWVTGESLGFTSFAAAQPDNFNDEDFVHLFTADGRWNDHSASHATGYILETGFYSNPLVSDSDGDGIGDGDDTFPGQSNRAPLAADDRGAALSGEAVAFTLAGLLANDRDPDLDPLGLVSFAQGSHGRVVQVGGALVYTPEVGFSGDDTFAYTIADPSGAEATASVTVFTGENTRPLAGTEVRPGSRFALQFDGANDFLDIAASPSLNLANEASWTIEAWVKPTQFNHVSFPTVLALGRWSASLGFEASSGKVDSWINNVSQLKSPAAVPLHEWTHLALVFTGTERRLVVNGTVVATEAMVGPIAQSGDPIRIGAAGPAAVNTNSYFKGAIDEVRVWRRALTVDEIASRRTEVLGGSETGLMGYWPLEEGMGLAAADASGSASSAVFGAGTAAAAPQWVGSDAPLKPIRRQQVGLGQDTSSAVRLSGSDADGNFLTATILSLPAHVQLFQFGLGGAAGAAITAVPAVVTDAERRIVVQASAGFTGADAFFFGVSDGLDDSLPAEASVQVFPGFAPLADDLWDGSRGNVITSSSGFMPGHPGENMFGGMGGEASEGAVFADGQTAGFSHFVEWETPSFLLLQGARLFAPDESGTGQRGFTEMRLFARSRAADPFTLVTAFRPASHPYPGNVLAEALVFAPVVGKQFRAEFDQYGRAPAGGVAVGEWDAVGETVVMVPSPSEVLLKNATADNSQSGFDVANLIDGTANGWAGDVGGTPALTAVFETAQNLGSVAETVYTFTLPQGYGGGHFLGRFRISATIDDRSQFADGLSRSGDVAADWTVLHVIDVTSTGGETFEVLPDASILVSGSMPSQTSYTVRAKGMIGSVTGFRLEMLEHASLPNQGPGRAGNGNWVLSEFMVSYSGGAPTPNRAPQPINDRAVTSAGFAVVTPKVLANDIDLEGDALSVSSFDGVSAQGGTVVAVGDGSFTYTPPAGFSGEDTFAYRASDGFQAGAAGLVTIVVNAVEVVAWSNAAGGNWHNAANWSPARVPGVNDVAAINLPGTYTVTLDGDAAVLAIQAGGAINGEQTLRLNGRSLSLMQGGAFASGSTLRIDGDGRLSLSAGKSLSVMGLLDWSAGTLSRDGRVVIAPGGVAHLATAGGKFIDGVLENRGTTNYTGASLFFGRDNSNFSARVENAVGGTFVVDGDGDFSLNQGSPNYRIDNAGTFIKRGAGTTTVVNGPIAFNNSGSVVLEGGALSLNASSSLGGDFDLNGSDDLRLNSGTYTLQPGVVLPVIRLNGAALSVAFDSEVAQLVIAGDSRVSVAAGKSLAVTGLLDWSAGTLSRDSRVVIAPGGVAHLATAGGKFIDGVLENRGTTNYTGASLFFGRDNSNFFARVENATGGTFVVDGDGDFSLNQGSPNYRIDNAGTFIKRGAGTTTVVNGPIFFGSSGTVAIESGELRLNGGSSLGGEVGGAGSLTYFGGSHTIPFGGNFEMTTLSLNSVNFTLAAGAAPNLAVVDINGSTLTAEDSRTFSNLTLRGDGRLSGASGSAVEVTGTFEWSAGTIVRDSRVVIAPGGVAHLATAGGKFIDGVLENRGTTNYTGASLFFGRDNSNFFARVENAAGGTFVVDGDGDFSLNQGSPNYRIDNAGTFIKRGAGTMTVVNSPIAFNNSGSVVLEGGALSLNASSSLGGDFDLTGSDDLRLNSGTYTLLPGVVLPVIRLNGAALSVAFDSEVAQLVIAGDSRVSVAAGKSLAVTGLLDWSAGTLSRDSRVVIAPGGVANLATAGGKFIDGVLENRGTTNYTGASLFFGRDNSNFFARVENAVGGTFVVDGDGDFSLNQGSPNYRIENAGTFIKRGAGTATVVNGPIAFMNRGDLECESGLLQFGGSYQHDEVTSRLVLRGGSVQRDGGLIFAGGGVEGGGTLIGPVVNAGAVMAVGTGGDQLRIEGSYVQLSGGTLRSTLAGSADGGALRHVALAVSGMATLDGGWEVAVAFPFAEALGADFAVVSYGSRVGEFGSVDGLSDNFGYGFTRSFEVGALHLAVTGEGEVAGPGLFRAMVSTGFDHWMQGQLQGVEEEVDSAREGDPDGDGASNWMEYAFGTSPRDAASRPVIAPILGQETGGLRAGLVYRSRSDNARLDYRVEVSGDLKEWALLEGAEIQRRPVPGLPLDEVEVKLAAGLPPEGKLYLRVKVEER